MTLPAILLKRLVLAFERYPLILFVGIGLTLFWLFPNEEESEVFFSQAERESVWVAHATQMGIPNLKAAEKGRVTKRLIDDEVLFREAKRLGLDKEDSIIKQRLIQKMLFIAEEEGGGSTPSSSQELVHYFEKHRKNWMLPRRITFEQLFFNSEKKAQAYLTSKSKSLPDAIPLPKEFVLNPIESITKLMGKSFAETIWNLPLGQLSRPVASTYGFHVVKVKEKAEPRSSSFEEVEAEVRMMFAAEKQANAVNAYLKRLYKQYHVDTSQYSELKGINEDSNSIPTRAAASYGDVLGGEEE